MTPVEALKWSERTVVQRGLMLPWEYREPYDKPGYPLTCPIHGAPPERIESWVSRGCSCNPVVKGTLVDRGEVYVPEGLLYAVAERSVDDYIVERMPPSVGFHEGLALEQAGLAVRETRGGHHGTRKLREFLKFAPEDLDR